LIVPAPALKDPTTALEGMPLPTRLDPCAIPVNADTFVSWALLAVALAVNVFSAWTVQASGPIVFVVVPTPFPAILTALPFPARAIGPLMSASVASHAGAVSPVIRLMLTDMGPSLRFVEFSAGARADARYSSSRQVSRCVTPDPYSLKVDVDPFG